MASLSKLRKAIAAHLDNITGDDAEEKLNSLLVVTTSLASENDKEPNGEEDGEEENAKPAKRGKLKAADEDDDNDDDDEENNDDEEDEPVSKPKKTNKVSAKKTEKKPAKKVAAPVVAKLTPENADFTDTDEVGKSELKELIEVMGLNLKKAKVSADADIRKLCVRIQKAAAKDDSYEAMLKKAKKFGVDIVQPRGRTTEAKKSRVAIVQMINAGHAPV